MPDRMLDEVMERKALEPRAAHSLMKRNDLPRATRYAGAHADPTPLPQVHRCRNPIAAPPRSRPDRSHLVHQPRSGGHRRVPPQDVVGMEARRPAPARHVRRCEHPLRAGERPPRRGDRSDGCAGGPAPAVRGDAPAHPRRDPAPGGAHSGGGRGQRARVERGGADGRQRGAASPAGAAKPVERSAESDVPFAAAAWQRIELAPGIEIHLADFVPPIMRGVVREVAKRFGRVI